jgi:hypothetical protein
MSDRTQVFRRDTNLIQRSKKGSSWMTSPFSFVTISRQEGGMIRYGRGLDVPALLSEHQIELRRIVAPIQ